METKEKVLATMKEAGTPLNAGKIAELSGLDKKEVDKAMKQLKEETKATIRCVPLEADEESLQPGVDMVTGKPSARRVLFARAY